MVAHTQLEVSMSFSAYHIWPQFSETFYYNTCYDVFIYGICEDAGRISDHISGVGKLTKHRSHLW